MGKRQQNEPTAEGATTPDQNEPDSSSDAPVDSGENAGEPTAEDTEGLVKMHKDGDCLYVHPTTVEAHKSAGWKRA